MRARHGCTSARLMADVRDPKSLLVLLEFPSFEKARDYLTETAFVYGGTKVAQLRDRVVGYYDDLPPWEQQVATAE